MSRTDPNCPTCRERMVEGFVLDLGHGNARKPTKWVEGVPEFSFWTGIKIKGKTQHVIRSFRCPRCGLLAEYAKES
ncbi:MAG: hypothetical protein JNL28_10655 [Planctomycetes bacterium]|nr:hypothetical protein [Planctomycetota bacterium]